MQKTGSSYIPPHLQGGEARIEATEFLQEQPYDVVPIKSRKTGQVTKLLVRLKNATSGRIVRVSDGV